jgi:hypothetical protein
MRRCIILIVVLSCVPVSCSLKSFDRVYKRTLTLDETLMEKDKIDAAENPAQKYEITNTLEGRLITLDNVVVKDIIPSNEIDYKFCVLSIVNTPKGEVEFYIYSLDTGTIAALEKGKTRIKVLGDFKRFFSLLDSTYIKIEITDADIVIVQ